MKFSSPIFFVYAKVCVTEVVWLGFPDLNECSEKKFTHLKLMLNCVDLTSNEEKKKAHVTLKLTYCLWFNTIFHFSYHRWERTLTNYWVYFFSYWTSRDVRNQKTLDLLFGVSIRASFHLRFISCFFLVFMLLLLE